MSNITAARQTWVFDSQKQSKQAIVMQFIDNINIKFNLSMHSFSFFHLISRFECKTPLLWAHGINDDFAVSSEKDKKYQTSFLQNSYRLKTILTVDLNVLPRVRGPNYICKCQIPSLFMPIYTKEIIIMQYNSILTMKKNLAIVYYSLTQSTMILIVIL